MTVWDVVVVGAGPAGTAASLAALRRSPDATVLMLDRADFPRDKPCGDGIAPHVNDVLRGLGAPDPSRGFLPVHRLALTGPGGATVSRVMRRPTTVVPRQVFDARLVEAATAAGAHLQRRRVRTVEVHRDRVVVDGELEARAVVGADGANGVVRRAIGVPPSPSRAMAVAIRAYAPVPPDLAEEQRIVMTSRGWPAYAWSFPIGDGRANVGFGMELGSGSVSRDELERGLRDLLPGVTTWTDARAHHLPLSTGRPRQPDGRVVLAGDAASLVNPFTGEGIYDAVVSGALAGEAALEGSAAGRTMRHRMHGTLSRHHRHTTFVARLGRWSRVVDATVRAAVDDQGVFDDLAEIGLADGLLTRRATFGMLRNLARSPG